MMEKNKRLIVVLGMHRSGTSTLARGLKVMGVQLGDRLIPAIKGDNDKGFWEDIDINALDNELLGAVNSDWFTLSRIDSTDVEVLHKKGYFIQAVGMLRKKTGKLTVFGIKDPRIAKLLNFWSEVFDHLKFDVSYVLIVRNPISVAKSLAKRNHFAEEQSHFLWLSHIIPSLEGTAGKKRVVVDYDRLMKSPEYELSRIANALDLEMNPDELQRYTGEFLDQNLRHTVFAPNDLLIDGKCPAIVQEVYTALLDVAAEKADLDDPALKNKIKKWSNEFERLKSPLELMDTLFTEKTTAASALAEREEQFKVLNQKVSQYDSEIANLNQALTKQGNQITKLNQALEQRDRKNTGLNLALTERDRKINDLFRTLSEYKGEIEERDRQISGLSQGLEIISRDLGLNANNESWVVVKPLKFYYQCLIYRPSLFLWRKISKYNARPLQIQNSFKGFLSRQLPSIFGNVSFNSSGNEYVPLCNEKPLENKSAKLICFYLPQFHPIPENDAWWGKGFTEWTSVQPAKPQFIDHYQPHIPDELGYYSLLDAATQRRQVELAKLYGIEGFCFYFYWFAGKTLLEAPTENYLNNSSLDLPFCLCWANESWSRTWDGKENDILIAQKHSPEDDIAFIRHISVYMRDSRYIRINGKPLLLVYRPGLLPSAEETAKRWRKWCRANGLGEIYLAYTQSFDIVDPSEFGFDAAIEFPPNNTAPPIITDQVEPLIKKFDCTIYDWRIFVERSECYEQPNYKLFRSVCPSWDNTARRKNQSAVFLNSCPDQYEHWLENAIMDTHRRFNNQDEHLVFVNAWNEWAEGAHLEPDQHYGYAWLQATRNALDASHRRIAERKIILVSHDAHPHGAQYLSLHMAKTLSSGLGYKVDLVLLGDGSLASDYAQWATIHNLHNMDPCGSEARALAEKLAFSGQKAAIVNTTVSGLFLETLVKAGINCIALIHELAGVLEAKNLREHAEKIAQSASAVVFPAEQVAESFNQVACVPNEKIRIRHQGLYKRNAFFGQNETARKQLRNSLGLDESAKIVLGVGYLDHRKGIDLFVEAGIRIAVNNPNVFFVWVGHWDEQIRPAIERRLYETQFQNRFLFVGRKDDTDMYYAGADVYALTSREDPFPSVVMESLEVSVPVVGFKNSGGFDTLLNKGCGLLVKKEDCSAFADAVMSLLNSPKEAKTIGQKGASIIAETFSFRHYVYDLLDFAGSPLKRVSVIVPNFNYAHHLEQRLNSIIDQTYPIYEIIVLDDASTDDSIDVIKRCLSNASIEYRLIQNKKNSGSVFKQWQRGIEKARGDYVWICEADDFAADEFIERTIALFIDNQVVISYSQSRQVDEDGRVLCNTYLDYTDDICQQKWLQDHISDGNEELAEIQAVKNTIPNVSGVIFKKSALKKAMRASKDTLFKLRIAGDWLIYANMLKQGKVGHISDSLNSHRRHQKSVTSSSSSNARHLAEIIFMQEYVAKLSPPNEEVRKKASEYVEKIYKQFMLDHHFAHNPMHNPEVKQALDSIS